MNLQRYASGLAKVLEAAVAVACFVYLAAYVVVAIASGPAPLQVSV